MNGGRCDVAVVGAGPAGALAGRLLAGQGMDVVLLERAVFPRFKVCGCCLNADALSALARAGLSSRVDRLGGQPLGQVVVAAGGRQAAFELPPGLALSRASLDQVLAAGATEAGARLRERTVVEGLETTAMGHRLWLRERTRATQRPLAARMVLVADGLGGHLLRGRPGFAHEAAPAARMGIGAVIAADGSDYPPGTIHMACGHGGYCGVVRLEGGLLAVAAAVDRAFLRRCGGPGPTAARLLAEAKLPAVDALRAANWQGTPSLTRWLEPRAQAGVFALGDAARYVEPFTGEGMAWAFAGAERLAELAASALAAGDVPNAGQWHSEYERLLGPSHRRCRRVARALRHPALVRTTVGMLQQVPTLGAGLARWTAGGAALGRDALH